MVDYVFVSHDFLPQCSDFEVIRPKELYNWAFDVPTHDVSRGMPDHSFLCWKLKIPRRNTKKHSHKNRITYTRHDCTNIPQETFNQEISKELYNTIQRLENEEISSNQLDKEYECMIKHIKKAMDNVLPKKQITIGTGTPIYRRKRKEWWNDDLTELWRRLCDAEKSWRDEKKIDAKEL